MNIYGIAVGLIPGISPICGMDFRHGFGYGVCQEVREMEDILGRLFYGDYSAFEDISVIRGSGESIHHRRGEITTQLKALVPGDNFKLIEELLGSLYQTQTEDLEKAFKAGVRLGAQFVAACLSDNVSGQGQEAGDCVMP